MCKFEVYVLRINFTYLFAKMRKKKIAKNRLSGIYKNKFTVYIDANVIDRIHHLDSKTSARFNVKNLKDRL